MKRFKSLLFLKLLSIDALTVFLPKKPDQAAEHQLKKLRTIDDGTISQDCLATSMIKLIVPEGLKKKNDPWILETYDFRGRKKNYGGDEFYISFLDLAHRRTSNFTSVAYYRDLRDGRYELDFVRGRLLDSNVKSLNRGILTIYLQYTCDIGNIWPPGKKAWNTNGALYRTYRTKLNVAPPLRDPKPLQNEGTKINLNDYTKVIAFGDSIMLQLFCITNNANMICNDEKLRRPNVFIDGKKKHFRLHTKTYSFFQVWMKNKALPVIKNTEKTAIVLNSGAWDILKSNNGQTSFDNHLGSLKRLILYIQSFLPQDKSVDIIWRSTTALHIHRTPSSIQHVQTLRYLSNSRAKALHEAQISLMKKLNVPIIDMFNYTYELAWFTRPDDAVHYDGLVSTNILNELYF